MSTISWNCCGLGNPRTVLVLKDVVFQKKLNFIFLIETLSKKDIIERLKLTLGYEGVIVVDPIGHSDGLAFFGEIRMRPASYLFPKIMWMLNALLVAFLLGS